MSVLDFFVSSLYKVEEGSLYFLFVEIFIFIMKGLGILSFFFSVSIEMTVGFGGPFIISIYFATMISFC